jgi:hypothetical protein
MFSILLYKTNRLHFAVVCSVIVDTQYDVICACMVRTKYYHSPIGG